MLQILLSILIVATAFWGTWLQGRAFAIGPVRGPAKCEVAWVAPTTNTNGTPLTDLARYDVYVSATRGQFTTPMATIPVTTPTPAQNTAVVWDCRTAGLTDGQKWATVRAVDLAGNPSGNAMPDPSAVADGATQADGIPFLFDAVSPGAPTGLKTTP